jgi:hypothetical protein
VSTQTAAFAAHGNLFDTQVFVDMGWGVQNVTWDQKPQWVDHTGNAYDALDRSTAKYNMARSPSPILTTTYDATNQLALPASATKITGETTNYAYNAANIVASISFSGGATTTPSRTYTYDPDLRATAILSSAVGTQAYAYDADGRVVTATEPSGQGGNVISYTYAPNGWRQSLSVAGMINRKLFDYSYQADGKETQELVHSAPGPVGTFTWTYTAAGRMLQKTDPTLGYPVVNPGTMTQTTVGPTVNTYDSYGRRNTVTWPDRGSTPIGYDAVDNPSSDLVYFGGGPIIYSERKELLATQEGSNGTLGVPFQYAANGHLTVPNPGGQNQAGDTFDVLDGNTLQVFKGNGSSQVVDTTATYSYDSSGRETQYYVYGCVQNAGGQGAAGGSSLQSTFVYDAEDHVASVAQLAQDYGSTTCLPIDSVTANTSVTWGPNGHPAVIAININGDVRNIQLHWDGDSLLFTSDDYGVHDVKIRSMGEVTEEHGYFYAYDRSQNGGTMYMAHSTISSGVVIPQCRGLGNSSPDPGLPTTDCEDVYEPTDEAFGFLNQNLVVQGVRGVDTTTTQWQSPDAVSGSIHDPTSQMPFVFERNNSIAYADPTGYDVGGALFQNAGQSLGAALAAIGGAIGGAVSGATLAGAALVGVLVAASAQPAGEKPTDEPKPLNGEEGSNTNPFAGPVSHEVGASDSHGNTYVVPPGNSLSGSRNGNFTQERGSDGKTTGKRLDRGGHKDGSGAHAHVPGVTKADGDDHLPAHGPSVPKNPEKQ